MSGHELATSSAPGFPGRPFSARRGLVWLAAYGVSGLALSALYATTGLGLADPLRTLTGWWCPLCGGTRMGAELLHGHVAGAFAFNPLAFVGLVVAVGLGLAWTLESLGGPALRPPRIIRRLSTNQIWASVGLVSLIFMIARNVLR